MPGRFMIDIPWDKNRVDMTLDDKCAAWTQVGSASGLAARKQKLWCFNASQEGMSLAYGPQHSPGYCYGRAYVVAANVNPGTKCLPLEVLYHQNNVLKDEVFVVAHFM